MTWHLLAPTLTMDWGLLGYYGNPTGYMGNIYMFLAVAAVVQWWKR